MPEAMSPVDSRFVPLPTAILIDPQLTAADKVVYSTCLIWAWVKSGTCTFYASISTIAEKACLSRSQVKVSLKRLEARRLVERERRVTSCGSQTSNMYKLLRVGSVYDATSLDDLYGGGSISDRGGSISDPKVYKHRSDLNGKHLANGADAGSGNDSAAEIIPAEELEPITPY